MSLQYGYHTDRYLWEFLTCNVKRRCIMIHDQLRNNKSLRFYSSLSMLPSAPPEVPDQLAPAPHFER